MTTQETELAVIIAELGIMLPLWRTLARRLARIIEHFKIPEQSKEHAP